MIIARAPLRISFVGGGTDLPEIFRQFPGKVISAAIDKYVYIAINSSQSMDDLVLKYMQTERAKHPSEFSHTRFRRALMDYGFEPGMEIGSFADINARTGLGSSSSFTSALIQALHAYYGREVPAAAIAEQACRLEIEHLNEPIGKQDQYAAAVGGFNVFTFNPDDSVGIEPLDLKNDKVAGLEPHLLLFYTGLTRDAKEVLGVQRQCLGDKIGTYKEMAASVDGFRDFLLSGAYRDLAEMFNEAWQRKKSLAPNMTNGLIDELHHIGISAGAWGGKVLGAGGGGCVLFIAPPAVREDIKSAVKAWQSRRCLEGVREIPVRFAGKGVEVIFDSRKH